MEKFSVQALCFSWFGREAAKREEDRNQFSVCVLACMCSQEDAQITSQKSRKQLG